MYIVGRLRGLPVSAQRYKRWASGCKPGALAMERSLLQRTCASGRVAQRGMRSAFQWAMAQSSTWRGVQPSRCGSGCWPRARRARHSSGAAWSAGSGGEEQLLQIELTRRVVEQVGAAHDVGDALVGVIEHHGQLVGVQAVTAPDDEVAHLALQLLAELALHPVGEPVLQGRHAQADGSAFP